MTSVPEQFFDEFLSLREAFGSLKGAKGGLHAMAGFDFQLTKAVLSIIRQAANGNGQTFVEVLSDIVALDKGLLVTQAKRTLSSSSLHSGLSELWAIYKLATEKAPGLLSHLRFQIASDRRVLQDWEASLERWTPEDAQHAGLGKFKALVSVDVSPSPRLEAAGLLVSRVKDPEPFARIDRFVAMLLRATAETIDQTIEEIRVELEAKKQEYLLRERRFAIWGMHDQPPKTIMRESNLDLAVRIGERLAVADLREGRLAPRSIYSDIEAGCEAWLSAPRDPYKLPTYWLSGRSGCGKSAALLHLAAALHAQNPDRMILWLGEQVERVAETVRWAAPYLREGRQVLLVLDDPFTAARQQAFARSVASAQAEWEAIRDDMSAEDRVPPMILCCGPTEQRVQAEEQCYSHIECNGFNLPIETAEDLEELAAWFHQRTGSSTPPMSGNVLLVQQMFEWTKGRIADFSYRFRERIRSFDQAHAEMIYQTIAQILALNRLYVDFPATHLQEQRAANPALDAALMTLGGEQRHFDFGASPHGGVRLTHPHLADAIYREWFGRTTDSPFRRRHLEVALVSALDQENELPEIRHAPLWSIARLAQREDRYGRVVDPEMHARVELIRSELQQVLKEVYSSRSSTLTPLQDLPVWIALKDELDLSLAPDPVDTLIEAVDAAEAPERGLRLSCHWLLGGRGDRERCEQSVARCLNRIARQRTNGAVWYDWVPVAIDFIDRAGHEPILESFHELVKVGANLPRKAQLVDVVLALPDGAGRQIAIDWLQQTSTGYLEWSFILHKLLKAGHCDASDAIAIGYLDADPFAPAWGFIWLELMIAGRSDRAKLMADGLEWIGVYNRGPRQPAPPEQICWDRVWQKLLAELPAGSPDRSKLIARGNEWLAEIDSDNEGWPRVWEKLWIEAADDTAALDTLLGVAEEMLEQALPRLSGWSHVWTRAVEHAGAKRRMSLLERGLGWIREAELQHLGWSFVWSRLLSEADDETAAELLKRGRAWLSVVADGHVGWGPVWIELARLAGRADQVWLFERGITWLLASPNTSRSWPKIATEMLKAGYEIDRIRPRLAEWLASNVKSKIWPAALASYLGAIPDRVALAPVFEACIQVVDDPEASVHARANAWDGLRLLGADRDRLSESGHRLLDDPETTQRARVNMCGRMLRSFNERNDPVARRPYFDHALALIGEVADQKMWQWVWGPLSASRISREMRELEAFASQWLKERPESDPRWSKLYIYAAKAKDRAGIDDPGVRERAIRVLSTASVGPDWIRLWLSFPDRLELCVRSAIEARAFAALREVQRDRLWCRFFVILLSTRKEAIRTRALDFADRLRTEAPDADFWSAIWAGAYAAVRERAERERWLSFALGQLGAMPPIAAWRELFMAVKTVASDALPTPEILRTSGFWLSRPIEPLPLWREVLNWRMAHEPSPWDAGEDRQTLITWLMSGDVGSQVWASVASNVVRHLQGEDVKPFRDRVFGWFETANADNARWPYIWASMWEMEAGVPESVRRLRALGTKWLDHRISHPNRQLVQRRVAPPRKKR